jgi:hypothetical protein
MGVSQRFSCQPYQSPPRFEPPSQHVAIFNWSGGTRPAVANPHHRLHGAHLIVTLVFPGQPRAPSSPSAHREEISYAVRTSFSPTTRYKGSWRQSLKATFPPFHFSCSIPHFSFPFFPRRHFEALGRSKLCDGERFHTSLSPLFCYESQAALLSVSILEHNNTQVSVHSQNSGTERGGLRSPRIRQPPLAPVLSTFFVPLFGR